MTATREADYSAAYLRDHAKLARIEAKAARDAADIARRAYLDVQTLMVAQAEYVSKDWWQDIIDTLENARSTAVSYSHECRERADELEQQAEDHGKTFIELMRDSTP